MTADRAKPHIIRRDGIWECRRDRAHRTGYGYTPSQALRDWAIVNRIVLWD